MEEKKCPQCGTVLPEDAKHCPECGTKVQLAAAEAAAAVEAAAETVVEETAGSVAVAETAAEDAAGSVSAAAETAERTAAEAVDVIKNDIAESVPVTPAPDPAPAEQAPVFERPPVYAAPAAAAVAEPTEDPRVIKEREKEREAAEKEAKKEKARLEAEAKAKAKEKRKERLANREPLTEEDVWHTPYQPISAWGWIGYWLLLCIPVVGFVLSIVWACGGTKKKSLQNYCIAKWIVVLISAIILIAAFVAIWIVTGNPIEWFQKMIREAGSAMTSI